MLDMERCGGPAKAAMLGGRQSVPEQTGVNNAIRQGEPPEFEVADFLSPLLERVPQNRSLRLDADRFVDALNARERDHICRCPQVVDALGIIPEMGHLGVG